MKRLLPALAAVTLLASAVPAFAVDPQPAKEEATRENYDRTTVIDDVIRMTKAGVSDEAIIRFIRESRDAYVVDADVIIALTDAKVSKDVLNAVMDEGYRRGDEGRGRRDKRRNSTTYYVRPIYNPWFYPYGFYDPFWPRVRSHYYARPMWYGVRTRGGRGRH